MAKGFFEDSFKVGVLGGGQLGRMLISPALDLDVSLHFLDPNPESPCLKVWKNHVIGDFNDKDTVLAFGKDKDVITVEIEHVNTEALHILESEGVSVYPQARVLDIIKDKGLQKQWYEDNNISTAGFQLIDDSSEITMRLPFVQKMRVGGYDGKGVQVVKVDKDLEELFEVPSVIEKLVDFDQELAVIVARNTIGEIKVYPSVAMKFDPEANLVSYLYSPSGISDTIEVEARNIASDIISKLDMVGILAVEFFLLKDGSLIVNEMAPRTHNSGHHTIEANITSQYEQHLIAILNLPLGDTHIMSPAVMVNLVGANGYQGKVHYEAMEKYLSMKNVFFHIYGKSISKPFRKMGHVTILRDDINEAKGIAEEINREVRVIAKNNSV